MGKERIHPTLIEQTGKKGYLRAAQREREGRRNFTRSVLQRHVVGEEMSQTMRKNQKIRTDSQS